MIGFFMLSVLAVASPASAEDLVIRDRSGRIEKRIEPSYPGSDTQVIRGRDGRRLGTIAPSYPGSDRTVIRGREGRIEKRIEPSYPGRSEEHTSELQSLMRISSAVFCLQKKKQKALQISTNH